MKTGIQYSMIYSPFSCYGDDKFNKIKEFGFDAVDFGMTVTDDDLYRLSKEEADKILLKEKHLAQKAGILINQVHGPCGMPPPEMKYGGIEKRMEQMKRSLYNTSVLGCKYTVIHPLMPFGVTDKGTNAEKKTLEANVEFFKELGKYASEVGVTICIENMPMMEFSIATPKEVLNLVKAIDNDHVRICLDTGHLAVHAGLDIGVEVRRLGNYLKVLHVHDNHAGDDCHLFPYKGRLDWQEFKNALDDTGFDGVISVEIPVPEKMPLNLREDMFRFMANIARHIANL